MVMVVGQTFEDGQQVHLASIDEELPEPMTKEALKQEVE